MTNKSTTLLEQVNWIHRCIYGSNAPDFVASRYLNAHLKYPQLNETDKINWLDQAVKNRSDLQALELVLRRQDPDNILTKKFLTLSFIVECSPKYDELYVNHNKQWLSAVVALASAVLFTLFKSLKGRILLSRYHGR